MTYDLSPASPQRIELSGRWWRRDLGPLMGFTDEDETPDYPVTLFLSREGYFKKITPQSLRMSGEQKYKEGDGPAGSWETTNKAELLVFTDRCQVYKTRCSEFDDTKASVLGDYLPSKLAMDDGESVTAVCLPGDYRGYVLFFFENGKVAKVALTAYQTVTNRRKLTGAYSDKSPLRSVLCLPEDEETVIYATDGRAVVFSTAQLLPKTTRSTQGVAVMTLRKKSAVERACLLAESTISNPARYRARSLPSSGAILRGEEQQEQQVTLELS